MIEESGTSEQLDRLAIAEIILRERTARDSARWEEMASYYHPESEIEVSWFRGSGAEFVERTKLQYEATRRRSDEMDRMNFHEMGAAVVTVSNDRAIAETACTLHSFFPLDGVACKNTGFVRLMWRAQSLDGRWLIAGLRCLYIRDLITPCNPSQIPKIDQAELDRYRPSYRFTSYHLSRLGLDPKDDLPGADRPETVLALRRAERAWLEPPTS
jgi:hypothetical protein